MNDDIEGEQMTIVERIFFFMDMRWVRYYKFQLEKCQGVLERTTIRKRSYRRKIKLILGSYNMEEN